MLLGLLAGTTSAQAYGIRVRWQHELVGDVTAYRVHVWPEGGPKAPPYNVGVPPEDEDGTLTAVVADLAPRVDYAIAVSAQFSDGSETSLSNVLRVAYADVAPLIDSDGDGIKDAADDCPDTPAGATVGPNGCSCDELRCDDGDPCNGVERCSDGVCLPGSSADGTAIPFIVRRFALRSTRGGRAWKLDALATTPAGVSALVPSNARVEVWGNGADMHFVANVASDRFAPRRHRLRFFAPNEGALGALRRLDIAEFGPLRTIAIEAVVPAAALPSGPDAPLGLLVRLGDVCARALEIVCTPANRRFLCR